MSTFSKFLDALESEALEDRTYRIDITMQVGDRKSLGVPQDLYVITLQKRNGRAIVPMDFDINWNRSGLNKSGQNRVQYQIVQALKEAEIANISGKNEGI